MKVEEYTVREVGESAVGRIAVFFAQNAYKTVTEDHLRRKYFENPAGRGRIFVMEDRDNEIQGTLGYMPHLLVTPQEPSLVVMESVDLFIAPAARGKKMFPKFQGSVMKKIGYPLIAFPNKRSEKITIELGWERFATIENWVYPVGSLWVPRKGARDLLLYVLWGLSRVYSFFWLVGWKEVNLRTTVRYEQRFDQLNHSGRVGRSPEYLNWRYENNPVRSYVLHEFEIDGEVVGYSVVSVEADAVFVYDFFSASDEKACMRTLAGHYGKKGFKWLRFRGIGLNLWKRGFVKWPSEISLIAYELPPGPWVFTLGDSDW